MRSLVVNTRRWLAGSALCGLMAFGGTAFGQGPPAEPPPVTQAAAPAECPAECEDVLRKVPPVRPHPRPGSFSILPAGPGYYSLSDALTGTWREGPPKYPYPRFGLMQPSFFDADFRYLDDPKNTETDFFDPLKRVASATTGSSVPAA